MVWKLLVDKQKDDVALKHIGTNDYKQPIGESRVVLLGEELIICPEPNS